MNERSRLISWDAALITGIALLFLRQVPEHYRLIIGFTTALILSNCIKNHIAAYKLNGKIY